MSFSVEHALRIATANLQNRANKKATAYTLHYSNDGVRVEGSMNGTTIKGLIDEFRANAGYKYAFITKKDDVKLLRYYNSAVSKKFFSMTRTGKKK